MRIPLLGGVLRQVLALTIIAAQLAPLGITAEDPLSCERAFEQVAKPGRSSPSGSAGLAARIAGNAAKAVPSWATTKKGLQWARGRIEEAGWIAYHFIEGEGSGGKVIYHPVGTLEFVLNQFVHLSPVEFHAHLTRAGRKTREIFSEQWWSKLEKELTPEAEELLQKYDALKYYRDKQAFMRKYPRIALLRKKLTQLTNLLIAGNLVVAADYVTTLAENTLSMEDYFKELDQQDETTVNLLIEQVPFPHTALQIGKKVYSFGVDHMTAQPAYEYFHTKDMPKLQTDGLGRLGFDSKDKESVFAGVERWMSDLPRTVTVIPLKLSDKERLDVKRELEMTTAHYYKNLIWVNDCSSMMARVLNKHASLNLPIPDVIDALPNVMGEWLVTQGNLGMEPRIGKPKLILQGKGSSKSADRNKWATLAGIGYIAFTEGKIPGIYFSWSRIPYRWWTDLTTDDSERTQFTPEFRERLKSWRKDLQKELLADDKFQALRARLDEAEKGRPVDAGKFREVLHLTVEDELKKARESKLAPNAIVNDILKSQIKIEILEQMRREFEGRLASGSSSESGSALGSGLSTAGQGKSSRH